MALMAGNQALRRLQAHLTPYPNPAHHSELSYVHPPRSVRERRADDVVGKLVSVSCLSGSSAERCLLID